MKKVIAIISLPQECGEPRLDFVSMYTGKVVKTLPFVGDSACVCLEYKDTVLSEPITFYHKCMRQRFRVGKLGDFSNFAMFKDRECAELLYKPQKQQVIETLAIRSCEDAGLLDCSLPISDWEVQEIHSWKYTAVKVIRTEEFVYHPELDSFCQEVKKELGIELTTPDRVNMSDEDAIKLFAKSLDYIVMNTLRY